MKKRIGIVFGGKSPEHEISIRSSKNVYKNLDKSKYIPILIYIDISGRWFEIDEKVFNSSNFDTPVGKGLNLVLDCEPIYFAHHQQEGKALDLDAIFPVLHGRNGEDGNMQGFFNILNLPFVGPDMTGSALCMDKELTKKLLQASGIRTANYICYRIEQKNSMDLKSVIKSIGLPLVVKPSRTGSAIGVTKVGNEKELKKAIELAFEYDTKILIEEYIKGRELECAVLGNENPVASAIGEIITEFYDYEAKYLSDTKAKLDAPAKLDTKIAKKIQTMAIDAYKILECEGMSRVDFFLRGNETLLNEINTIPGFTNISMYPKLFELSGISNQELITRLIELAIERFDSLKKIKTFYEK